MALVPSLFSSGSLLGGGLEPFTTLHREMNRLFDDVLRGTPMAAATTGRGDMLMAPSIDVTETDTEMRIRAELPGVDEKDVEVSLHDDVLSLRAEKRQERKEEREGVHFSERAFGTFQRSLRLPFAADPEQVQARMENGVLTVTLPKSQAKDRSRRIQIQGAQKTAAPQAGGQQAGGQQASGQQAGGQQVSQQPAGEQPGSAQSGQANGPGGATDGMVPGVSGASEDGAPAAA